MVHSLKRNWRQNLRCWYFEISEHVNSWNYACYLKLLCGALNLLVTLISLLNEDWFTAVFLILTAGAFSVCFCLICPCSGLGCSWSRNNLFCKEGRQTWVCNWCSGIKTPWTTIYICQRNTPRFRTNLQTSLLSWMLIFQLLKVWILDWGLLKQLCSQCCRAML